MIAQRPIEFPAEGLRDGDIRLRLQADADLPALIRACQDPEIARWTRVPAPYGEAEATEWHERQARARAEGEMLSLLLTDARTDELLGSVGIVHVDWEEGRCELGYWVARESRGRGLAARAVRVLCGWILESLPIDRVEIHAEPENTSSRRVAEAAGFRFEGVLRSYFINKGERRDAASYSLLRGELPS